MGLRLTLICFSPFVLFCNFVYNVYKAACFAGAAEATSRTALRQPNIRPRKMIDI